MLSRLRPRIVAVIAALVVVAAMAAVGLVRLPAGPPEERTAPITPSSPVAVWVSSEDVAGLPTSGRAWDAVLESADQLPPHGSGADVSDQDSDHDQRALAAALVCVRTGQDCARARGAVVDAIGTEVGPDSRWLAVGRNLPSYAIAADLLDLRADGDPDSDASRVEAWLGSFLTMRLPRNNDQSDLISFRESAWQSGSNASAQEGFAHVAVAAYLHDGAELAWAWDRFRRHVCDPTAPDRGSIDLSKGVEYGWAHDPAQPCAVNPAGATKVVPEGAPGAGTEARIDGAIINDMRRGGEFQDPPRYTQYPWVGLEGLVPAAVVLDRQGYDAFGIEDGAVLRTVEYLWDLRVRTEDERWFDGERAGEVIHLVNHVYGMDFLVATDAAGEGRTVGFTDWTHARVNTMEGSGRDGDPPGTSGTTRQERGAAVGR